MRIFFNDQINFIKECKKHPHNFNKDFFKLASKNVNKNLSTIKLLSKVPASRKQDWEKFWQNHHLLTKSQLNKPSKLKKTEK
jgi:hypothetical protein